MSNEPFDFNSFLKESKAILVNPKQFFSTLKTYGGFTEPLVKTVIYGAIGGVFALIWSVLNLSAVSGGFLGSAIGVMGFIWSIIGAVIALFVVAVLILIISSICNGNTDFEANLRVSAALMVLLPIHAFFGFTSGINISFGMLVSLGVNFLGLWLLIHALIHTLKAKAETVKTVSYVLAALLVVFMLATMASRRAANSYRQDFNSQNREIFKN